MIIVIIIIMIMLMRMIQITITITITITILHIIMIYNRGDHLLTGGLGLTDHDLRRRLPHVGVRVREAGAHRRDDAPWGTPTMLLGGTV